MEDHLAFGTNIENKPVRNSITQTAETWTRSWHTHPYAITDVGRRGMKYNVLRNRICMTGKSKRGLRQRLRNVASSYLRGASAAAAFFERLEDVVRVTTTTHAAYQSAFQIGVRRLPGQ